MDTLQKDLNFGGGERLWLMHKSLPDGSSV